MSEVEQVNAAEMFGEEDTAPLSSSEFDQMGGYTPLDVGVERLRFSKIVQKTKKAKRGYTMLNARLEMVVDENAITNNPGRKTSVFFDFPSPDAQRSDEGLKKKYNIELSNLKEFICAFLGATKAEDPGDYPVVDGPDGEAALLNPINFLTNPDYQDLLVGRTLIADVKLQPATWTDKATGKVMQRPNPNNEIHKPRIDNEV